MSPSKMKSADYPREYWVGGVGSEYRNYGDDPGWHGILTEIERVRPAPARILEVGSAMGHFILHATERGYDAEGIDISEYAVSQVRPVVRDRVHPGNIADGLPWPDESADVVFSSEFLEHMYPDELPGVLADMYRVLKPGGLWLHKIGIIPPDNHPFRQSTVEDHSAHFTHFTIRTREEWIAEFEAMGLQRYAMMEDALDERFKDRDWIMRFFSFTK